MTILVFDTDKKSGGHLAEIIGKQCPMDDVHYFCEKEELIRFAGGHLFQVVFLRVCMKREELKAIGHRLTHIIPGVNLILVAEDEGYCLDAIRLHASGYMLYPADGKKIRYELQNLLYPVTDKLPVIRIEGSVPEIYINDSPAGFAYSMTAALFEILISLNGAMISTALIGDRLWDESKSLEKKRSYLQNLRLDLKKTLAAWGLEDALKHRRGKMWLDMDRFVIEDRRNVKGEITENN